MVTLSKEAGGLRRTGSTKTGADEFASVLPLRFVVLAEIDGAGFTLRQRDLLTAVVNHQDAWVRNTHSRGCRNSQRLGGPRAMSFSPRDRLALHSARWCRCLFLFHRFG